MGPDFDLVGITSSPSSANLTCAALTGEGGADFTGNLSGDQTSQATKEKPPASAPSPWLFVGVFEGIATGISSTGLFLIVGLAVEEEGFDDDVVAGTSFLDDKAQLS